MNNNRISLTLRPARHRHQGHNATATAIRSGVTLTEVLFALAIMAIGVISLASLFPISVLKTARASQLTTGADISYNARSWMQIYPHIVNDPDPTDSNGDGIPFNDVGYLPTAYLFDPLAGIPGRPIAMPGSVGLLPRFGGGFNTSADLADSICSNLDSWSVIHEGAVTSVDPTRTSIQVGELNKNKALQWPGPNQMRVHVTFNGGKESFTRMVTSATNGNPTLSFSEDANGNNSLDPGEDQNGNGGLDLHALPAAVTFETARVETRERRYSWLLTCVNDGYYGSPPVPSLQVRVVVYYGRGFSLEEEQVYGTPPPGVVTPIPNLLAGSSAFLEEGKKQFTISWPAGQQPYLKRGGWVLDAEAGNWYQIENYIDPTPTGATTSTITLVTNIQDTSRLVVFPRGVVEVF